MSQVEIKNRWSGAVMFAAELGAEYDNESASVRMGAAVKLAISARTNLAGTNLADANLAGAYLAGAYLAGANLADANLAGAYLAGANLADANLAGAYLAGAYLAGANLARTNLADANLARTNLADANLAGANLAGANLADANLAGAYLAGAYLAGANLADAKLRDDLLLTGKRPILQIGPIGSRSASFMAHLTNKGLYLRAGCFFGTRAEFEAKLADEHDNNEHAQEYRAALEFIAVHERLWTPVKQKDEAA